MIAQRYSIVTHHFHGLGFNSSVEKIEIRTSLREITGIEEQHIRFFGPDFIYLPHPAGISTHIIAFGGLYLTVSIVGVQYHYFGLLCSEYRYRKYNQKTAKKIGFSSHKNVFFLLFVGLLNDFLFPFGQAFVCFHF